MDTSFDQNTLSRILLTLLFVGGALGPSVADFNRTHATNPLWTGHARFHVVWQVLSFWAATCVGLAFLWTPSAEYVTRLYLMSAMVYGGIVAFYITYLAMPLYGGKAYDSNGYLPWWTFRALGRSFDVDSNFVFVTLGALLNGYALASIQA